MCPSIAWHRLALILTKEGERRPGAYVIYHGNRNGMALFTFDQRDLHIGDVDVCRLDVERVISQNEGDETRPSQNNRPSTSFSAIL